MTGVAYSRLMHRSTFSRMTLFDGMSEQSWQNHVIEIAHSYGWLVTAMHVSRDLWWGCDPGVPDLLMARRDRTVIAELKSAHGRLSLAQELWITTLKQGATEVYVWRPSDESEVLRVLA